MVDIYFVVDTNINKSDITSSLTFSLLLEIHENEKVIDSWKDWETTMSLSFIVIGMNIQI